MRWLAGAVLFLVAGVANAATYKSDGSLTTVGNCTTALSSASGGVKWLHDNCAANGDTITLPAGTFDWSTGQLVLTKAITISGASQAATIVNSSRVDNSNPKGVISWTVTVDPKSAAIPYTWGIQNLAINKSGGGTFTMSVTGGTSGTVGPQLLGISRNFVMHHVTVAGGGFDLFQFFDVNGLLHHCTWSNATGGQIFNIYHTHWPNSDNTAANYGHGSYQNPVPYGSGSDQYLVIEDCDITTVAKAMTDSWEGGRFVVRHCNLHGTAGVSNHGTESHGGSRGCRAVEEYNNWETGLTTVPEHRSGTWIGFNNIVNGQTGAAAFHRLQNHRDTLIKDLGGVFGTTLPTPTFLGAQNLAGGGVYQSHATVDQNTPLADPNSTPGPGNEPITDNESPILYAGTASTAILVNQGGTFTVSGSPGWSASTGGPIGKGTWKTLDAPSFVYADSAGFNYVVTNTSVPPGNGSQPTSTTGAGPAIIDSNGTNTLTIISNIGNNNSKSFFINAGQTFNIRAVYNPLDAPGRGVSDKSAIQVLVGWPHQQFDPNYEWNNWTGTAIGNGTKTSWRVTEGIYVQDRDFFIDTVKPGYPQISSPTNAQRTVGTDSNPNGTLLASNAVYGAPYPDPLTGVSLGKIIDVGGPMLFGNVLIGDAPQIVRAIQNTGDTLLTVSSVDYTGTKFTGATTGFTIAAGAIHNLTVTYTPTTATADSETITVNSDADSGVNSFTVSGTGVEPEPPPIFFWKVGRSILGRRN